MIVMFLIWAVCGWVGCALILLAVLRAAARPMPGFGVGSSAFAKAAADRSELGVRSSDLPSPISDLRVRAWRQPGETDSDLVDRLLNQSPTHQAQLKETK
jgi:hypothetical protein